MIKFAICDDEPQMAREIVDQLAGYMKETDCDYSVDCFSSGYALLKSSDEFDVIFLDIQMERPDGMETARLLRQRDSRSLLIFVTVLKDRVFDVFPLEAFDYLLKPLDRGRFRRTMDRALRWLERDGAKNLVIQRGLTARSFCSRTSCIARCWAEKFIFTKRTVSLLITMTGWKMWNSAWIAAFSSATAATL